MPTDENQQSTSVEAENQHRKELDSLFGEATALVDSMFSTREEAQRAGIIDVLQSWGWRLQNVRNIGSKFRDELKRRKIDSADAQPLNEGDAYRAMEACSLEDDDLVQTMWANLVTSAVDPSNSASASKAFVEILRSIGPAEAGLLIVIDALERMRPKPSSMDVKDVIEARNAMLQRIRESIEQFWHCHPPAVREIAELNLLRLRCIGYRTEKMYKASSMVRHSWSFDRGEVAASAEKVAEIVDRLESLVIASMGLGSSSGSSGIRRNSEIPREVMYAFTPLGKSLMTACIDDIHSFLDRHSNPAE